MLVWQVPAPKVPEKFMAPIAAEAGGKAGDKARVQAFFTELPEDVTAALIKKCAATALSSVQSFPQTVYSSPCELGSYGFCLRPAKSNYDLTGVAVMSCNMSEAYLRPVRALCIS